MTNILQTSGKYEVYFDILQSECKIYSSFSSNILQGSDYHTILHIFFKLYLRDTFFKNVKQLSKFFILN